MWYPTNTPRIAISPAVQPGQCWAFQGFPGFLGKCSCFFRKCLVFNETLFKCYLVLKLNAEIFVTGFTIEHIPKNLAPNGKIDSAPKTFTVWVLIYLNSLISII